MTDRQTDKQMDRHTVLGCYECVTKELHQRALHSCSQLRE